MGNYEYNWEIFINVEGQSMNKIHKVIFNKSTQTMVAVSEFAKVKTALATAMLLAGTGSVFAASVAISQNDANGNAVKGNATTSADLAVAIGNEANAKGKKGVAIGNKAVAGTTGTAIGDEATANGEGSMALGSFAFVKSTWVKSFGFFCFCKIYLGKNSGKWGFLNCHWWWSSSKWKECNSHWCRCKNRW